MGQPLSRQWSSITIFSFANDLDYKNGLVSCKGDGRLQHFFANHPFKSPPLVRRTVHLGQYFFKPARILPGFDGEVSSKMGSRRVTMTSCWEGQRGGGRQAASLSKFFTPYMFIEQKMFKRWYFRFQTRFWLRGAAQKRSSRSAKPSVKHLVGFRTRLLRVSEELDF